MSTTIQLGVPRPDGTTCVAVWLAPVTAERWRAQLGPLPETARGGEKREHRVFRVPSSCIRADQINLAAAEGMHVEHYGDLKRFDGGEVAELPARWLAWLITQGVLLDAGAVEYGRTTASAPGAS